MSEKLILSAISGKKTPVPPIWLMRQAGRYLPEYREIRKKAGSFLNLCYTPELAAKVTLQPIQRFDFDASIIFSDILVVPHAMGMELDYVENKGPVLNAINHATDINHLSFDIDILNPVFSALKIVSGALPPTTALIGFAGAPWTVATYMVEGGSSKHFQKVKQLGYQQIDAFSLLIEKLIEATSEYLVAQIDSGAEIVQLFDSWAGVLCEYDFSEWVIKPTKKIVERVRSKKPDIPIIGFPKGAGLLYEKYVRETGISAVGLDYTVPLEWAVENIQSYCPVQGNLDPVILASGKHRMIDEVEKIINGFSNGPHIFNLGHGILPNTPIENVEMLVEYIRQTPKQQEVVNG